MYSRFLQRRAVGSNLIPDFPRFLPVFALVECPSSGCPSPFLSAKGSAMRVQILNMVRSAKVTQQASYFIWIYFLPGFESILNNFPEMDLHVQRSGHDVADEEEWGIVLFSEYV